MSILWRKNFDIRRVDYNLPIESLPGFGARNYLTVGKNVINKIIWVVENGDNIGTYVPAAQLRELAERTLAAILKNPNRVDAVHKLAIKLNQQYFKYAEKIRRLKITRLTNRQLLAHHHKLFNLQYTSHVTSLPTTWFVDSDQEDCTKYLTEFLKQKIQNSGVAIQPSQAFSILTTSAKPSFAAIEEQESLRILELILKNSHTKHWFMSRTTEELVKNFGHLPTPLKKKILDHVYSWCWTPYTYCGPTYSLDYYLEVWRGLLHEDMRPKQELRKKAQRVKDIQKQRTLLIKQLGLSQLEKHWYDIAADITWLKGYRKDCMYHGFYVLDILLAEIAKRSGLSLSQAKFLIPTELPLALQGKDFSQIANDRIKFSVIYGSFTPAHHKKLKNNWHDVGLHIFTGKKAKAFLKRQKFEKSKIVKTNQLFGTCACSGQASGVIKTINLPEEMAKMNAGDIMLSHTTFPSLVPAMKKASAIITEDGGITCHAAIVARELQIPCIVGCKNALHILKDGDRVSVNATNGIIKKLNK